MDYTFSDRLKNAWNAFRERGSKYIPINEPSSYFRPDRLRYSCGNERSIVYSIYNRIALDVASVNINHVRVDENDKFVEIINSSLNNALTLDANMDQTGRDLMKDITLSMFDEGCVAVVPVDTNVSPVNKDSYEILTLRVGKITQWYPSHIKVSLYNERKGKTEEIVLPKKMCAIIENPFYAVMNEQNSTSRRLIRKLNILDAIDEQSGSGKLDLIIQLPYVIKSDTRKDQAEKRRKDIEMQLTNSKYGIAYTDGTEHITQLNRSVDNNLLSQIEYLTKMLYSQLGITDDIMNGTANEGVMTNYYNRTVEPVLAAISDEMKRKFLTKTARTQGQSIKYFRDPFKLVTVDKIANIADTFTRNEILTSNEVRGIIGFKPVDTNEANELRNKNLNRSDAEYVDPYGTIDEEQYVEPNPDSSYEEET